MLTWLMRDANRRLPCRGIVGSRRGARVLATLQSEPLILVFERRERHFDFSVSRGIRHGELVRGQRVGASLSGDSACLHKYPLLLAFAADYGTTIATLFRASKQPFQRIGWRARLVERA